MSVKVKYYIFSALEFVIEAAVFAAALYGLLYEDYTLNREIGRSYVFSDYITEPININTASVRELQKINGVGSVKAEAIISYREEHGGFDSPDELLNVSGIGEATLEKIRNQITI